MVAHPPVCTHSALIVIRSFNEVKKDKSFVAYGWAECFRHVGRVLVSVMVKNTGHEGHLALNLHIFEWNTMLSGQVHE